MYEFIQERIAQHGRPPSIREIGQHFGIRSTNGVRTHLAALIRKGYLKKASHLSRGLTLTHSLASQVARLPVVGSVPAGLPIDAVENIDGEVAVDLSFVPSGEVFTLRVTGDSMKNAGILDGDLVLVQKQQDAQKGDIVVAIIGTEATVKRFIPKGEQVILQPENDDFDPIIVDKQSDEFAIAGKVVGLLRRM